MIRILFRVPGVTGETLSTVHSAEVHGQKSALLLNPEIEIIGFEDCREQDVPSKESREKSFGHWIRHHWGPTFPEVNTINRANGGIPIPPHLVPDIERAFRKDKEQSEHGGEASVRGQEIPVAESIGIGATAMDYRDLYERKEIQAQVSSEAELEKAITDAVRSEIPTERPTVLYGQGLSMQLWLLMRPSGEFVKSTTEEGGESYIACKSEQEALKVAEQQKIYDIDCVPHRVF